MFFVYAIMNPNHEIYVGYSSQVIHRLRQHRADEGASATKANGPWSLFWLEAFSSEKDAKQREGQIIRDFNRGVFLEITYYSRKRTLEEWGRDFEDWEAALANSK